MKLEDVYLKYLTPKNLQEHMLRVASLAKIILDEWTSETVDQNAIITACALHDLAKPITFDLYRQADFGMSESDISNLEVLQKRLRDDYGDDEYKIVIQICKELGCSANVLHCIKNLDWAHTLVLLDNSDIEPLILIYCDMRIGPHGLLTIKDRIEDSRRRESGDDFDAYLRDGIKLEELITTLTTSNLGRISNSQIQANFEHLMDFWI